MATGQPRPEVQVRCDGATGELVMRFVHNGAAPCQFTLSANVCGTQSARYVLAAHQRLLV